MSIDHTLHRTAKPELRHPSCDKLHILGRPTTADNATQWGNKCTCLLCCGDSRLSFCHINTRISKKTSPGSNFCHKNRVANTVLVTKVASRRCLLQSSTDLEMHQNRFRPGLRTGPTGAVYSAAPDP